MSATTRRTGIDWWRVIGAAVAASLAAVAVQWLLFDSFTPAVTGAVAGATAAVVGTRSRRRASPTPDGG